MRMKPLMMMRTRGVSGPRMMKHRGVTRIRLPLSKSNGNAFSAGIK